jgi:hypothetical protein
MTLEMQSEPSESPLFRSASDCEAVPSVRIAKTPALRRTAAACTLRRISGHDRKMPPAAFVEENPPLPTNAIRSYDDLHRLLRARADALQISRLTIDHISGLQEGYSAKVLSLNKIKRLGPESLGPLLDALALKLIAVPDDEAFERNRSRLVKRDPAHHTSARKGHDKKIKARGKAFADISGLATATLGGTVRYVPPPRFESLSGAVTAKLGHS